MSEDEQQQQVGGLTPEDLQLLGLLGVDASGGAGGGLAPKPIGGVVANSAPLPVSGAMAQRENPGIRADTFTPYYEGDEEALVLGMNTEELARVQDALVASGLIRSVIPGERDDATMAGMGTLMALANRSRRTWGEVLSSVLESGSTLEDEVDRQAPLVKRDPVELAQIAKDSIEKTLRRNISDSEAQAAASVLAGFDLQAAQQQLDVQEYAGTAERENVELISPDARFRQWFEDKYRPELDRMEIVQTGAENRQATMANIGAIDRMMGF